MKNEIILKKCPICGALVKVIKDGPMVCCGQMMEKLEYNSNDYSHEKHLPIIEKKDDNILVTIPHVMDEEHYIQWICMVTEEGEDMKWLNPQNKASVVFPYVEGSIIYSYCNLHGLWKKEVR